VEVRDLVSHLIRFKMLVGQHEPVGTYHHEFLLGVLAVDLGQGMGLTAKVLM